MQGLYFDELSVGQTAETTHVVGAADIEAFAKTTPFGGRIAHGMLAAAYISAVLGNQLPGPGAIYLSQSLRFRRPVKIGDPVTARVTVKSLDADKAHATFETACLVGGKTVVDGEALIMVPRRDTPRKS